MNAWTALFLLLPAPSVAETWPPSFLRCYPSSYLKISVPDTASADELTRLLHPAPFVTEEARVEKTCTLGIVNWAHGKANVAVIETAVFEKNKQGGGDEKPHQVYLALLDPPRKGEKLHVLARLAEPLVLPDEHHEFARLDLANFRIRADESAFGVRISRNYMYGGGGGGNETLVLYRRDKDKLQPIFRSLVESSNITGGDWHKDGTRDHNEDDGGSAVIDVARTEKDGFFDLVKRLKGRKKSPRMTFRWNGTGYVSTDAEIVRNVNDHD